MAGHQAKYPLQTKFWKSFGKQGIFLGTVVGYFPDDGVYKCYYENDGDKEDLTEEEIESWLKRYPSASKLKKRTEEQQPNKERGKKSAPEKQEPSIMAGRDVASLEEPKKRTKTSRTWKEQFERLVSYKRARGDCLVPAAYSEDKSLGTWVFHQRRLRHTMSDERRNFLDSIAFVWDPIEQNWNEMWAKFRDFQRDVNDGTNVAAKDHDKIQRWVTSQREKYRKGVLLESRKEKLESVDGFAWGNPPRRQHASAPQSHNSRDEIWKKRYQSLLIFKEEHNHVLVPYHYEKDKKLGKWVQSQRTLYAQQKLPSDRMKLLDEINFVWSVRTQKTPSKPKGRSKYSPLGQSDVVVKLEPFIHFINGGEDVLDECAKTLEQMLRKYAPEWNPEPRAVGPKHSKDNLLHLIVEMDKVLDNSERSKFFVHKCELHLEQCMQKEAIKTQPTGRDLFWCPRSDLENHIASVAADELSLERMARYSTLSAGGQDDEPGEDCDVTYLSESTGEFYEDFEGDSDFAQLLFTGNEEGNEDYVDGDQSPGLLSNNNEMSGSNTERNGRWKAPTRGISKSPKFEFSPCASKHLVDRSHSS